MLRQIKLCISQEDGITLDEAKRALGFKSDYQFAKAAVEIMLRIIKRGGQEPVYDLPEEIAAMFYEFANYSNTELGKKNNRLDKTEVNLLFPKQCDSRDSNAVFYQQVENTGRVSVYARQFMDKHYEALYARAKSIKAPIRSDGYTPMDIFQSTIEVVLNAKGSFKDYQEFEKWAMDKFIKRVGRF